ncbi:hypothetical protein O181_066760 [Austropuccinia psidii MF-1]|uniref:Uncharacterized protein n=1 Tax=Austropuccinia psidii MF-1 TaxID=1389203 RepID=A0A9Q3EXN2_9BASI|nr:hypothetical protein [Austropuccinia psidii MF-1]
MSPLDATPFRLVIGSLAYLVSGSMPDLEFAVNYLAPNPGTLGPIRPCGGLPTEDSRPRPEYIALSDSTQHLVQAINQLNQLVGDFDKTIFCNNQATIQVSLENKSHKQMRYLDLAFLFVNNTIRKYSIKVTWIKMDDMLANALAKRLSGPTLLRVSG